jgi:Arthropod cardioacceleratory peptide 2a.
LKLQNEFLKSPRLLAFFLYLGCGKKRSDESMGTLVDLNSEPAVEDLSRQILSEAKLWEAIQEARVELLRRRQEQVRHIPS